jgi:hypothetical protein
LCGLLVSLRHGGTEYFEVLGRVHAQQIPLGHITRFDLDDVFV